MNIYDIWIDSDDIPHVISEMDDDYLCRCYKQLKIWKEIYKYEKIDSFSMLSKAQQKEIRKIGGICWCFVNCDSYINSIYAELEKRELLEDGDE